MNSFIFYSAVIAQVRDAKRNHGVKQLLVWHTLSGYWAGVQPINITSESEWRADGDGDRAGARAGAGAGNGQPDDGLSELDLFGSRVTFPSLPAQMHRMSLADALPQEPFTTDGVGLIDSDK